MCTHSPGGTTFLLRRPALGLLATLATLLTIAACSQSNSVVEPPVTTAPSYLDPELSDSAFNVLMAHSTLDFQTAYRKQSGAPQWLADSVDNMVTYALSMVSRDPAKHIPYVWGGKQIETATPWAKPPSTNTTCDARIGLDCSGFVGLVLKHSGFKLKSKEVSVAGLVDPANWEPVTKRGYDALIFSFPDPKNLLPGDILIFSDGPFGTLSHTGIFVSQEGNVNGVIGPSFVNSLGRADCHKDYANEASGHPTGVMVTSLPQISPLSIYLAIRIVQKNFIKFTIDGQDYFGNNLSNSGKVASVILDTALGQLDFSACDDTDGHAHDGCMWLFAQKFDGKGQFEIPETDYDSSNRSWFWSSVPAITPNSDSVNFYLSPPPSWWLGDKRPQTGGQITVHSFARDKNYGTINATFQANGNAYWSRIEDSTYFVDTTKVTLPVKKYLVRSVQISGNFEGLVGLH